MPATVLDRLEVLLTADDKGLATGLNAAARNVDRFAKRAQRAGRTLTARLTAPIVGLGIVSVKAFGDFDAAMTKSTAIMGNVSDVLRNDMAAAAKDVARSTTISATEAADSYFFLASAGLDAQQSIAALPQVAAFAQAGMFDMSTATDLATDAQSALGLAADDVQENLANLTRVTDVLVKANTLANASVEQFATALTTEAGAALKTFNIPMEEGVAVLAAFADQGVKGEKAGSGLARVLRLMAQAATKNQGELQKLGIRIFDEEGNMRNLADIVGNLEVALGGMSDAQRTAALESIGFSARVQGVILPLLGTSDAIREYESGLRDAGGTTAEIAKNQLKGFNAAMTLVKDNVVLAAARIGEVLAPSVRKAGEFVKGLANRVENLNPEVLKWTVITAGLAAALGPVLIVVGQVASGIGVLLPVIGALVSPVGLVVAGVAAAAFAFVKWKDEILAFLGSALRPLQPVIDAVVGVVKAFGRLVVAVAGPMLRPLAKVLGVTLVGAFNLFKGAAGLVVNILKVTLVPALKAVAGALDFMAQAWPRVRDFIVGVVKSLVEGVRSFLLAPLQAIWDKVKAGLERVKGFFSGLANAVVGNSIVPDMVDAITSEFDRLGTAMDLRTQLATRSVAQSFSALSVATGQIVPAMVNRAARDFRVLAGRMRRQAERIQVGVTKAFFQMATGVRFGMGKTVESAERGTRAVSSNFQDMKNSLVRSLSIAGNSVKRFVQSVLTQLGRIAGGAIGGAIGAAVGGAIGSFFGGLFQHGGTLPLGKFGVVGEAGPELVAATPRGAVIQPFRARTPSVAPAEFAGAGGRDRTITLRLDTSSLPPPPRAVTPDAIAVDTFWREAFSRLVADARDRGVGL